MSLGNATLAHASHQPRNAFEGGLAGGGDPATSPLYVFGPFLKLIVTAGGTQITFGASVWLVVITIAMVYAMPARTIVNVSEKENVDISMLASRGRGSLDLLLMGSVAEKVVRDSRTPVFLMPVRDRKDGKIAIYASEY